MNIDSSVFLFYLFHTDFESFSVLFYSTIFRSCNVTLFCRYVCLRYQHYAIRCYSKLINWSFKNTSRRSDLASISDVSHEL